MSDILDEVLNDEKDEKRLQLFRKIFPAIIIATVIIAIVMSCYSWYKSKQTSHNQAIGDIFVQLVSGEYGDSALIDSSLENITQNGENRQAELAALKLVHNKIEQNDIAGALARLELIISNTDYYNITTSYARILWISLILDKNELSESDHMKARDYLQYFHDENQAFYATATLLKSLFYKKNSQVDLAKEYAMKVVTLERAPLVIKEQANAVLASLKQ